jgi:Prealbumin-like fold domain
MSLGTFRQKPIRRRWVLPFLTALMLGAVTVIVASALGVLAGSPSKFEANDGNMVVNTTGNNDWNSVAGTCLGGANVVNGICTSGNYVHLTDIASSTGDDSFASGQKQDVSCPVINTNKNPPKDDFTDIASFNETNFTLGSPQFHHTFLYGATIRVAPNGNADENIELNKGTSGICTGTTDQLKRSTGDKLIAIDYTQGGTAVEFKVFTWVTGSTDTCFVGNDSPLPDGCWGANPQSLSQNAAEGQVNQAAITAANNGISGLALVTGQFAEFGVDLTAAGIIPAGSCQAFPQTIWESRASASSFVSSIEDVKVEHHTISNCGNLVVKKVTVPSPDPTDTSFSFHKTSAQDSVDRTFSLKNGGSDSEQVFAATDFSVTETIPANWTLTSATCSNGSGTLSGGTLSGISVAISGTTTCTFTNTLQLGAIKITKTSSKAAATPLAGAKFSITSGGTPIAGSPFTTLADGTICVDGLQFGNYVVTETAAPTGYAIDDATAHTVTVDNAAKCSDATYVGESISFTDTPLTDLTVNVKSEASGGTKSSITCTGPSPGTGNIGNSPQPASGLGDPETVTANGLKPGTYSCTVVIDP